MGRTFPNESPEYRTARNQLLEAEIELRAKVEQVAALRRKLPPGGAVNEDYCFSECVSGDGSTQKVRMGELFEEGKNSLFVYSFMWAADAEKPCPMCTSFLASLDAAVPQLKRRINLVAVARADAKRLKEFAKKQGWQNLRMLSADKGDYLIDYWSEKDGSPQPMANVFCRDGAQVRHFWGSELLYCKPLVHGGDSRHIDMMWPLWNVLDVSPDGRGEDFRPIFLK